MMNWSRPARWLGSFSLYFAALGSFVSQNSSSAADSQVAQWTHWRGPSGQGYSEDTHVPLTWDATHNLLWKAELRGAGNSSPIIWGDRVFLTESRSSGK